MVKFRFNRGARVSEQLPAHSDIRGISPHTSISTKTAVQDSTEVSVNSHSGNSESEVQSQSQSQSQPLAPNLYLNPDVLALENKAIFSRSWQLIGHITDLPEAGSYITGYVGDQPVVIVRDKSGQLNAFRNVCRHRGSELVTGDGTCKNAIRCRYHGWTYRLDGTLIGVPEHRSVQGLNKAKLPLHPVQIDELAGLLFVNLDEDATPLSQLCSGLQERLAKFQIPTLKRLKRYSGKRQRANWKIVVENYLEGYHIPIAHPGLMRLLDYQNYDVELNENWVWFEVPLRDKPSDNRFERLYQRTVKPIVDLPPEERKIWRYAFIYPNTMIELYPDQVGTWRIQPDGTSRTFDIYDCYRSARPTFITKVAQLANRSINTKVFDEDVEIVEAVQRGIATDGYNFGPLSAREAAIPWFADRIRADLKTLS